jgi:hypothetical protein
MSRPAPRGKDEGVACMNSVVITHKQTGKVVAQIQVNIRGQNYTPSPAEYHAEAWRIATTEDRLIPADADKDDYAFEIVPVSIRDAFSPGR